MTKFTNAQSAAAAWWINFLKNNAIVNFVGASEHAGRMRLTQRIAEALANPTGDGKVRLAFMPTDGLTFLLASALRNPRINSKSTCVFMELSADYVHVSVDDAEQLIWRNTSALVRRFIPGHMHRNSPRLWPAANLGLAELLSAALVGVRSEVLSPEDIHQRFCQADGCRCDSPPEPSQQLHRPGCQPDGCRCDAPDSPFFLPPEPARIWNLYSFTPSAELLPDSLPGRS